MSLLYTIASVVLISLISFVGILTLLMKKELLDRILLLLIAFASGSLLAAAFLHMAPESAQEIGTETFKMILAGMVFFFIIEKFIHWHHCNRGECSIHPVAYLNLIGDGVHNFIDGVIIAAGFLTGTHIGVITSIAIALHEIPQEIGDFAVLVHGGLSKKRALLYNFLSATTAIIGAVLGYFYLSNLHHLIPYVLGIAAGGFVYIAAADLMPELHKERTFGRLFLQTIALLTGIYLLYLAAGILPHAH